MTNNLIGQQIEHYLIEGIIGEGGMGTVYRAEDLNLARPVAMKVMHPQFAAQTEFQRRFQQEAQAAARLSHLSIVSVYHFGRQHGQLYLVMELVPGLSLGAYIKQLTQRNQVVRLDETVLLMAQVADALGYAHRKGVVHRDIKPDNIIARRIDVPLQPNHPPLRAVVTDFGLAKLVEGGMQTQSGEFMGTLAYVSPEQVLDKPIDGRSDLYSLGVVLFQLATGRLPFDVRTPSDAILKHIHEPPPRPVDLQPGLPQALENVILKALAKKPEDRYQSGEEMARALRAAATDLSPDDVAHFTESSPSQVVSVVDDLDHMPDHEDTPPMPMPAVKQSAKEQDFLLIQRAGEEDQERFVLYKDRISIGRSEDNDLVLQGAKISRRHAVLERQDGRWTILDLGSTNGTRFDTTWLKPMEPQAWLPPAQVRIGDRTLSLSLVSRPRSAPIPPQPTPDNQPTPPKPRQPVAAPPPVRPAQQPSFDQITSDMRPKSLEKRGIARVLVLNKGGRTSTVNIRAIDPNGALQFDANPKQVTVSPGQKGIVDFYVQPSKRPFIGTSKTHPFAMQVDTQDQKWDTLEGEIKVKPVLPLWLILAFGVMLMLLAVAAAAGFSFFF